MSDLESATNIRNHISSVLAANVMWARRMNQTFPQYFPDPQDGQAPKVLWIGCSDSRVLDSDMTVSLPGDMFVHRNIANQFHLNDDNVLSVFAYAVKALGVQHVVVVGHEHCGGAISALKAAREPLQIAEVEHQIKIVDSLHAVVEQTEKLGDVHDKSSSDPNDAITRWLAPLVDLARKYAPLLLTDEEIVRRLVAENVELQIRNISQLDKWVRVHAKMKPVWVHGWVCDFSTGNIRDLQVTKVLGRSSA